MQRGSYFVKEHVLANMSFMSYAQMKVFARKGRNWMQTIADTSFDWKRHIFTIRVQTVGPVPHCMFDIVAATIGQHGRATGPPRPIHCCCCPQRKNQGALNQALRIATTEWGLTAQIIISSAYINRSRAPWYMRITHERHVCEYMFLHKKWSSLHGLSSLSFCQWGPVTPCIHIALWSFKWK